MIVYTAVFGGYDRILPPKEPGGARWVCITDGPNAPEPWQTVRRSRVRHPRFLARLYKIRSHRWFTDDVVVWIDGNVRLTAPPESLEKYLENTDIAAVEHRYRHNHYHEAKACIDQKKGDKHKISQQARAYFQDGCPGQPVGATFLLLRRQTEAVVKLNELWWRQIIEHSMRDQISLPWCLWRLSMEMTLIPGTHLGGKDYERGQHLG